MLALLHIDLKNEKDRMAECIDNYLEAAQACEWCTTENTRMGDEDMARCIELCLAVADGSILHAHMLGQDSDYSSDLAGTCAKLCETCAEECEQHDHCQTSIEALQKCADSCRDIASA